MTENARIHLLPDGLINQIAAGEVVERPASVVKELLENALDAGATRIAIDIEEGGKRLIRVVDDGCGIHPDDLPLALTRHATSKIDKLSDLSAARTLGFRGEALPSIASVSHLTVRSTRVGLAEGLALTVSGEEAPQIRPAPPVPGTTVEVADLFFNTPARAKFLKAPVTEWGHIAEVAADVALGALHVHVTVTHNGRAAKTWPAAGTMAERVRQLYPEEVAEQLIEVNAEGPDGFSLTGLISRPGFTRSGRTHQKMLVGGRPIKNSTLSHAIYAAFETNLSAGRHPVYFLSLGTPSGSVDVNVHPAKREIRLADGARVHHFVRDAVRDALGGYRGNALRLTRMAPAEGASAPAGDWTERIRQAAANSVEMAREPVLTPLPFSAGAQARMQAAPAEQLETAPLPGRVVGQIHNTFVLVETGDALKVIDQHTAHERVLYERLLKRYLEDGLPAQRLLIPVDLTLPAGQAALVTTHRQALEKLGLDIEAFGDESFGETAFIIRSMPEPLKGADPRELLADMLDDLAESEKAGADAEEAVTNRLHKLVATIACHAAVKAGDPLNPAQMLKLIGDLEQVQNPHTCPHGRAVTAIMDKADIKGLFDRNWGG